MTSGRDFQDARGRTVELREYRPEDRGLLLAMYRTFDPEQRAQGIPPVHPLRLQEWVDLLTGEGGERAGVVRGPGGRPRGAGAGRAGSHELAVFVHQEFQGAGIGTRLVRAVLEVGRTRGVRHVWLTVEPWNGRACALYRRVGFQRTAADPWEEVWELEV